MPLLYQMAAGGPFLPGSSQSANHRTRSARGGLASDAGAAISAQVTLPLPPYAELLDLSTRRDEDGRLFWLMPFGDQAIGRPGFLHGGAIAGLLEFAALGALHEALQGEQAEAKPINVTVDFMRGGAEHDTFAAATVTRLGKRVANVEARAWQQDYDRPIAAARMNLLLSRPEAR